MLPTPPPVRAAPWPLARLALRLLALLTLLLTLLSCDDSNPLDAGVISPDGHYLALRSARGELGIMSLTEPNAPLRIFSRALGRGLAWSPDSRRLAFIEQPPGAPSALRVMDLTTAQPTAQTFIRGVSWKADPVWLSTQTLAYLTDMKAERVNIWTIDVRSGQAARLIEMPADISRLWGNPRGGSFVFLSHATKGSALWFWSPRTKKPVQLLQDPAGDEPRTDHAIAFSIDGRRIAWLARGGGAAGLAWYDLEGRQALDRLKLEGPTGDLAVLGDGRIAVGQGDHLLVWQPRRSWFRHATLHQEEWNGLPLKILAPWKAHGLALAANGSALLLADNARQMANGRLSARRSEDLLAVAYDFARRKQFRPARNILGDMQQQSRKGSRDSFLLAAASGELERIQRHWRAADHWLDQAIKAAAPGSPEQDATSLERLAVAAFEDRDLSFAEWLRDHLPDATKRSSLAVWLAALDQSGDRPLTRQWQAIVGHLRQGEYAAAAPQVRQALSDDRPATLTLRGLALLLNGDFEPYGEVDAWRQQRQDGMMNESAFQLALLQASRLKNPAPLRPMELRGLLLTQWVRQGDFSSARVLVREALERDPEAAANYVEVLRQYLDAEELAPWLQRTVLDVLLKPDIAQTLAMRLSAPPDRLTLRLAEVKGALVEGNPRQAQAWLAEARLLAQPRPMVGPDAAAARLELVRKRLLIHVFQAKINERRGDWRRAREAYQACLNLMVLVPGDWDVMTNEVVFAQGLIDLAVPRDPALLASYLRVLRGMGDPLINPGREPNALQAALSNLQTLSQIYATTPWIQPYLAYTEGMCYSQLGRSWQALACLERARHMQPLPSLLQRILLEEAALRDTLGEHALAAQLYAQILGLDLPAPLRASAILACLQSELAAGTPAAPADRLRQLTQATGLPAPWREWLRLQFDAE